MITPAALEAAIVAACDGQLRRFDVEVNGRTFEGAVIENRRYKYMVLPFRNLFENEGEAVPTVNEVAHTVFRGAAADHYVFVILPESADAGTVAHQLRHNLATAFKIPVRPSADLDAVVGAAPFLSEFLRAHTWPSGRLVSCVEQGEEDGPRLLFDNEPGLGVIYGANATGKTAFVRGLENAGVIGDAAVSACHFIDCGQRSQISGLEAAFEPQHQDFMAWWRQVFDYHFIEGLDREFQLSKSTRLLESLGAHISMMRFRRENEWKGVVVDGVFAPLDQLRKLILAQILAELARHGQVVATTRDEMVHRNLFHAARAACVPVTGVTMENVGLFRKSIR